jgi:uncharacterized membrane protein HdeD (DUF308 family)
MIILSIIIFNNPETVLSALAFWLGITVAIGGLAGLISWFETTKQERNMYSLIGSIVMLLAGLLMIFKLMATVKAITMLFGVLTTILGFVILSSSWKNKPNWSLWWLAAILGIFTLITGIKGVFDSYSGSESISNIIGLAVLFSGLGLIALAVLKRKVVTSVKEKISRH